MKKLIAIATLMCMMMLTLTGCSKAKKIADVILESETTVAVAETPTTAAPTTTASATQPVTTVASTTQASATDSPFDIPNQIVDMYNNPEYTDMYAYYDSEADAVVVFVYGNTSSACAQGAQATEGTTIYNQTIDAMISSSNADTSAKKWLVKEGYTTTDVCVVYTSTYNVNKTDLWANGWIYYSANSDAWEAFK